MVSRCFPGGYNVKLYIIRGRLAWWLLAFLHNVSDLGKHQEYGDSRLNHLIPLDMRQCTSIFFYSDKLWNRVMVNCRKPTQLGPYSLCRVLKGFLLGTRRSAF